ncbi:unnamed protein product [Mytilus coruscus]|uniref:Uncharacterized protein n=1 Tax=Mytilus coruscus TaxID=42192 RepID=A0A6J8BX20_MYTCO|nr:unnamed protein product [Mytilus coruscus]
MVTLKSVALVALATAQRSQTLSSLNLKLAYGSDNSIVFKIGTLLKTSRPKNLNQEITVASFSVTSCSIARWLKVVLTNSGKDISKFKAHSYRSASSSAALNSTEHLPDLAFVSPVYHCPVVFNKYKHPEVPNWSKKSESNFTLQPIQPEVPNWSKKSESNFTLQKSDACSSQSPKPVTDKTEEKENMSPDSSKSPGELDLDFPPMFINSSNGEESREQHNLKERKRSEVCDFNNLGGACGLSQHYTSAYYKLFKISECTKD